MSSNYKIISGGNTVVFSPRTITVSGEEFPYSEIEEVRHSEEKRAYAFRSRGEMILLPYEPKHEQVMRHIFGQVESMIQQRNPKELYQKRPKKKIPIWVVIAIIALLPAIIFVSYHLWWLSPANQIGKDQQDLQTYDTVQEMLESLPQNGNGTKEKK